MKNQKRKSRKQSRTRTKLLCRKVNGGGILDTIGNLVVTVPPPSKSSSKMLPFSFLDPEQIKQQFSSTQQNSFFQIYYNYNTPKPFSVNANGTNPIASSIVDLEPHIIIGNMNRYLVVLVDEQPYNKLLWVAEFANNSKKKTILSYRSPTPISKEQHNYFIKFYTYPQDIPPFTVMDISGQKRKTEYTNFIAYINNPQYKDKIKLVIQFPLNIYKDTSMGIGLFNAVKAIKFANTSSTQNNSLLEQQKKAKQAAKMVEKMSVKIPAKTQSQSQNS